jgi:hypothetical protein
VLSNLSARTNEDFSNMEEEITIMINCDNSKSDDAFWKKRMETKHTEAQS